jgi:hypothetical protein
MLDCEFLTRQWLEYNNHSRAKLALTEVSVYSETDQKSIRLIIPMDLLFERLESSSFSQSSGTSRFLRERDRPFEAEDGQWLSSVRYVSVRSLSPRLIGSLRAIAECLKVVNAYDSPFIFSNLRWESQRYLREKQIEFGFPYQNT